MDSRGVLRGVFRGSKGAEVGLSGYEIRVGLMVGHLILWTMNLHTTNLLILKDTNVVLVAYRGTKLNLGGAISLRNSSVTHWYP